MLLQAKKILETFQSLPFSLYTTSPSEEETLSLFNNLPFSNFPALPSPPCSSRRIEVIIWALLQCYSSYLYQIC
jgi:hypothetical protein